MTLVLHPVNQTNDETEEKKTGRSSYETDRLIDKVR